MRCSFCFIAKEGVSARTYDKSRIHRQTTLVSQSMGIRIYAHVSGNWFFDLLATSHCPNSY